MHVMCTEWPTDATESRKYEKLAFVQQKIEIDFLLCWLKMRDG